MPQLLLVCRLSDEVGNTINNNTEEGKCFSVHKIIKEPMV